MIVLGRHDLVDTAGGWSVTATTTLATGHVVDFIADEVTTPDGSSMSRQYVAHPGAVGVIALDDEGRIALVRQYRHPVRHRLVEPPAGLLDVTDEDPLVGVKRELAEEVGLEAATWRVLVDVYTSPGMSSEAIRVYLARDLSPTDAPEGFVPHGEEADMDVVWADLADVVDAVLAGDVHNPLLVSGVLAAWTASMRGGFDSLRPADAPWPARDVRRPTRP